MDLTPLGDYVRPGELFRVSNWSDSHHGQLFLVLGYHVNGDPVVAEIGPGVKADLPVEAFGLRSPPDKDSRVSVLSIDEIFDSSRLSGGRFEGFCRFNQHVKRLRRSADDIVFALENQRIDASYSDGRGLSFSYAPSEAFCDNVTYRITDDGSVYVTFGNLDLVKLGVFESDQVSMNSAGVRIYASRAISIPAELVSRAAGRLQEINVSLPTRFCAGYPAFHENGIGKQVGTLGLGDATRYSSLEAAHDASQRAVTQFRELYG